MCEVKPIEVRATGGYRCQFCGETSPVKEWKNQGATCPKCGRDYDWLLAQESEDD